jgi:hypothetical protein
VYEQSKAAIGQSLGAFFNNIAPTTKALTDYVKRPLPQAILWAPGRMVDLAEDMLASWQRDDSRGDPTKPYTMPIMLVAMAKDKDPSGPEFNRGVTVPDYVVLPDDPKDRLFKLRTYSAALRVQVAIAAHDEPSATSLASQLLLWYEAMPNRKLAATYRFAGMDICWPAQMVLPEMPASNVATETKNLTLLTVDLTVHATVPFYQAPKPGEPNDGQGDPNNPDDPAGYPFLTEIEADNGYVTETITDPQP